MARSVNDFDYQTEATQAALADLRHEGHTVEVDVLSTDYPNSEVRLRIEKGVKRESDKLGVATGRTIEKAFQNYLTALAESKATSVDAPAVEPAAATVTASDVAVDAASDTAAVTTADEAPTRTPRATRRAAQ